MKNKIYYIAFFLFVAFISTAAIEIIEECDATALKNELKRELRPEYRYDSSKSSRFTYKETPQIKEIEVPLFMGERYRFLFNTSCVPEGIDVKIYNKSMDKKNRTLLYTMESIDDQKIYTFEPEKSRKMYINYIIPGRASESEMNGCMIFVLGYQLAVLKSLD